jgi:hypothetical protein
MGIKVNKQKSNHMANLSIGIDAAYSELVWPIPALLAFCQSAGCRQASPRMWPFFGATKAMSRAGFALPFHCVPAPSSHCEFSTASVDLVRTTKPRVGSRRKCHPQPIGLPKLVAIRRLQKEEEKILLIA